MIIFQFKYFIWQWSCTQTIQYINIKFSFIKINSFSYSIVQAEYILFSISFKFIILFLEGLIKYSRLLTIKLERRESYIEVADIQRVIQWDSICTIHPRNHPPSSKPQRHVDTREAAPSPLRRVDHPLNTPRSVRSGARCARQEKARVMKLVYQSG